MKCLDIGHYDIGDDGARHISDCIDKIEMLRLYECGITDKGVATLSENLSQLSGQMRYLSLSGNKNKDEGASLLLSDCIDKINVLRIAGCGTPNAGVKKLRESVSKLEKNMSRLDISGNLICETGAVYISQCIGKVDNLGLNRCNISDDAVEQFSQKIKSLEKPMEYLFIGGNQIGEKGGKTLESCIEGIKYLDVGDCGILKEDIERLKTLSVCCPILES